MPIDDDAGIASIVAAVRVITILASFSSIGPPAASKTKILNVFSPDFVRVTSTVAPSFRATRPEDQPVSRLSTWNAAP